MKYFIYSIIFCLFVIDIKAQQLFFQSPYFESANVAFEVRRLNTGESVASFNARKSLTPASVLKIITTATALELLGPNFRFKTNIDYDGELTADGELTGNLYIVGSGDPTLGSYCVGNKYFMQQWVQQIRQRGIRRIRGAVVADISLFDFEGFSPKWIWEDVCNYYAAGVYAVSVYDNMCRVTLRSGREGTTPEVLKIQPEIPNFELENHLIVKDIHSDSAYFYGAPLENKRKLFGAVPVNKDEFIIKGDMPNPPLFAAQTFTELLRKNGIIVEQSPRVSSESVASRITIFSSFSPPLTNIIKEINHHSNNFYAEHLLKYLGLQHSSHATLSLALGEVRQFWKSKGLDTNALFMYDGSGLSPQNAVSPAFLVDLLCEMTKSPNFETFYQSLPIAGVSGTVGSFLLATPLATKARIKSGSFMNVQCYAGYISDEYAFAIMVNNFSCSRRIVRHEIERWLQFVVQNNEK